MLLICNCKEFQLKIRLFSYSEGHDSMILFSDSVGSEYVSKKRSVSKIAFDFRYEQSFPKHQANRSTIFLLITR